MFARVTFVTRRVPGAADGSPRGGAQPIEVSGGQAVTVVGTRQGVAHTRPVRTGVDERRIRCKFVDGLRAGENVDYAVA